MSQKTAPIGGLPAPVTPRLPDIELERVRLAHHEAIVQLQQLPAAALRVLPNVKLTDGAVTPVRHGLGRRPRAMFVSPPRGASSTGRIDDMRSTSFDPTQVVVLKASGWGATVFVDITVL